MSRTPDVTIYWRPGCGFCRRLETAIGADRDKATWRNIWADAEAREFVAMVNDGNGIVPTVVIDGRPRTNPDPGLVVAALRGSQNA